ncbi:MAG: uncharacterized protein KVP18_002108 [Porospora cf. gigantea A]|uniref:uncharacterized protein n=1 Tax=Porospora cf. gigantea A TaxID=2853593 RepID=UPI00355ABAEC|nr:MAG: hypothetical protein KVP18_002108 [Porospora cf. gigantea A]
MHGLRKRKPTANIHRLDFGRKAPESLVFDVCNTGSISSRQCIESAESSVPISDIVRRDQERTNANLRKHIMKSRRHNGPLTASVLESIVEVLSWDHPRLPKEVVQERQNALNEAIRGRKLLRRRIQELKSLSAEPECPNVQAEIDVFQKLSAPAEPWAGYHD